MAARRDAENPGRSRLLLPPAHRRRLPYANICEQCDNYVTAPEFIPQLQAQLADITALRDDAAQRGWHTEVARHSRVIASLQAHLHRLKRNQEPDIKGDLSQGRLIEAQFTALRYFTLDGTGHASHKEQASTIRRYIIWRNNHAYDERLRRIVDKANVA